MAGTRLRGGSRSLARSGFTRNEKYNVGAAVRGKEELSPTACPAAGVSYFMRPPARLPAAWQDSKPVPEAPRLWLSGSAQNYISSHKSEWLRGLPGCYCTE